MPAVAEPKPKQKLFYKINEVSKLTRLKPYVLRYWETEFPQLAPEKDANDQRRYRTTDIDLINKIKHLLYDEKFTIAGAKQQISSDAKSSASRRNPAPKAKRAPAPEPTPEPEAETTPALVIEPDSKPTHSAIPSGICQELGEIREELQALLTLI